MLHESRLRVLLAVLPAALPAGACRSGGTPESEPESMAAADTLDRLERVELTHEVDGRTVLSVRADEALVAAGERALLRGVSVRFPRGLVAAGGAAIMALTLGAVPAGKAATVASTASATAAAIPVIAAMPAPPPSVTPLETSGAPMEIEADRLEVDHRAGKATFVGHVVAVRGETTLRCERIDASYEPEGGLRSVVATGSVTIASRRLHATGARATYLEAERAIVIEGGLTVTDGKSTMTGERARILLDEERFVIEKARGKIVFAPRTAAAPAPARAPHPRAPAAGVLP